MTGALDEPPLTWKLSVPHLPDEAAGVASGCEMEKLTKSKLSSKLVLVLKCH